MEEWNERKGETRKRTLEERIGRGFLVNWIDKLGKRMEEEDWGINWSDWRRRTVCKGRDCDEWL